MIELIIIIDTSRVIINTRNFDCERLIFVLYYYNVISFIKIRNQNINKHRFEKFL